MCKLVQSQCAVFFSSFLQPILTVIFCLYLKRLLHLIMQIPIILHTRHKLQLFRKLVLNHREKKRANHKKKKKKWKNKKNTAHKYSNKKNKK